MRLCVLFLALVGASALRVPFVRRAAAQEKTGSQFESVVAAALPDEPEETKRMHITQGIYDLEDRFLSAVPHVDVLHQLSLAAEKLGEQLDAMDEAIQKSLNGKKESGVAVMESTVETPVADDVTDKADGSSDPPVGKIVGFVEDMVDQLYFGVPAQAAGEAKTSTASETPAPVAPVSVATTTTAPPKVTAIVEEETTSTVAAPKPAVEAKKSPAAFEQLYKSFQTVGVEAVKAAKATQETAGEKVAAVEEAEETVEETAAEAAPVLTTAELVKVPLRGAYEMLRDGRTTRRKFAVSRVRRSFAKVFRRKWLRS